MSPLPAMNNDCRPGCIPLSTVLRKWVRFFVMTQKPWRGDFREFKSRTDSFASRPQTGLLCYTLFYSWSFENYTSIFYPFPGRIPWSSQRSGYDNLAFHWSPALSAKWLPGACVHFRVLFRCIQQDPGSYEQWYWNTLSHHASSHVSLKEIELTLKWMIQSLTYFGEMRGVFNAML